MKQGRCKDRRAAGKYIGELIPKESYYQKKILEALRREFPTGRWRKNAAGFGQNAGEPDLDGVLDGRFIAIEVKRPLLGVASEFQLKAIREIRAAGGCAIIACYADEVIEAIKSFMEFQPYWYELTGGPRMPKERSPEDD